MQTIVDLIDAGLVYPGATIRLPGEDRVVRVAAVEGFFITDSEGRTHGTSGTAQPIVDPIPNVE
jgi:hypothetical protein